MRNFVGKDMRKRKDQKTTITHYLNNIAGSTQSTTKSTAEISEKITHIE